MALDLVVDGLATSRLARLVVDDYIAEPLRDAMSSRSPHLAYLAACRSCASVYAAAATIVMPRWMKYALAASEIAIIVNRLETNLFTPSATPFWELDQQGIDPDD